MRKLLATIVAVVTLILPATPAHAVSTHCGSGVRPWGYSPPWWCR